MPSSPANAPLPARRPRLSRRWLCAAAAVAGLAILAAASANRPLFLVNLTPSEPEGLYLASRDSLAPGRIVAFHAPGPAFPYADDRLEYLHRTPLLKAVAAVPGDHVCSLGARLLINNEDRAGIAERDGRGARLPRWRGCRRLSEGEVFVFSGRVPNSFDSRYFGPVPMTAVIGVYVPVLTASERG